MMMTNNRLEPKATSARTTADRRVVEVASPDRPSLRERVELARNTTEGAALERLRRDVCRHPGFSQ